MRDQPDATASVRRPSTPLTAYLAPVAPETVTRRFREWDAGGNRALAVWSSGGLVANLVQVLEHRSRSLSADQPPVAAAPTRADVATRFLAESFDDARCARLLGGLVWAHPVPLARAPSADAALGPPFAYAALKLLFAPDHVVDSFAPRGNQERGRRIPLPAGIVARLRRGDVDGAVRLALDRARASGIASPFAHANDAPTTGFGVGTDGRRLAAAMLIPIHDRQLQTLLDRAYPTDKETEDVA